MMTDAFAHWAVALAGVASLVSLMTAVRTVVVFRERGRMVQRTHERHVAFVEGMLASGDEDLEFVIHRQSDRDRTFVIEIKSGGSLRRSGVLSADEFARIEPVLAEALAV